MKTTSIFPLKLNELEFLIKSNFEKNADEDLLFSFYEHQGKKVVVFGILYLLDIQKLESALLAPLLNASEPWTVKRLKNELPVGNSSLASSVDIILTQLFLGKIFIYIEGEDEAISYVLSKKMQRSIEKSETESVVIGPQPAFIESLETNLNLLQNLLPTPDLVLEKIMVGTAPTREVRIAYMKSIANTTDVNTMRQRIQDLKIDELEDSTVLTQYISDSSISLFPQFYLTELPNRVAYTLQEGKIGVLVENSPLCIIAPSTFFSFFETMEDKYMRWPVGSALRMIRMIAAVLALLLTPLYVAIVTYQYELIPTELLISLGQSRAGVPFPPIIEALIIELFIELLREAGARLPTKVGQTMGIVGGIVIGQAAVDAGLTSNILIIVVAASALASYTSPSYSMGTTIRIIRFPIIFLASLYGILGIMFGICLVLIHLLKMTSLGRPYIAPLYPLKVEDFSSVFFRLPPADTAKRATMYQPKDPFRYSARNAKRKRDIDE